MVISSRDLATQAIKFLAHGNFRTIHRWIGLVLLIQVSIWAVSGAYMVWVQLPYIHGGHLGSLQVDEVPPLPAASYQAVQQRFPEAERFDWFQPQLTSHPDPLLRLVVADKRILVSPQTLAPVRPLQSDIEALALQAYQVSSTAQIGAVNYVTEAPRELNPSHLPVWRVDFKDRLNTTLYFSADTGELVTRRFVWWRVFDFMWMLHIMDYQDRSDITKPWLQGLSALSIAFVATGFVLLIQRLKPRRRRRPAA